MQELPLGHNIMNQHRTHWIEQASAHKVMWELTLALSLKLGCLVGGCHAKGALGAVGADASPCLPLSTRARSDLWQRTNMVSSGWHQGGGMTAGESVALWVLALSK